MDRDIKVLFPGGKRVDVEYKGFMIQTDQPAYQGGDGSAPAPFDLFLASIAACAGYYALAFCQNRGIATEKLSVVMRTEKNPETKMVDRVSIAVTLPPEFPEKYTKAVLRSVESCAVNAHIMKPPAFEVSARMSG